jgi:hypothetical protein
MTDRFSRELHSYTKQERLSLWFLPIRKNAQAMQQTLLLLSTTAGILSAVVGGINLMTQNSADVAWNNLRTYVPDWLLQHTGIMFWIFSTSTILLLILRRMLPNKSSRISFIDVRAVAEKAGWNKNRDEILDLLHGLRQAASEGSFDALGYLTFRWNTCESWSHTIFKTVSGMDYEAAYAISHDIGDASLLNKIKDVAKAQRLGHEIIQVIENLSELYNRCRQNRNQLTHFGISAPDPKIPTIRLTRKKGPILLSR